MAHISDLRSGMFTYLDIYHGSSLDGTEDEASDYVALFAAANSADVTRMPSVRDFPSFGVSPNIVNVPVYGQRHSVQVNGQGDLPTIDVNVNYVPNDMTSIHDLLDQDVAFRVLLSEKELSLTDSLAASISTGNTSLYFSGRIVAIPITPNLSDATTATVTISAQSLPYGPVTR